MYASVTDECLHHHCRSVPLYRAQTRTVAGLLGIEQTVGQTVLIGVIVVGAVLIWAAEVPLPGRD